MKMHPLLTKALSSGNPIVEDEKATFIWHGTAAPKLVDDVHGWDEMPQIMIRVSMDLWNYSLQLPKDAYLEYAFINSKSGERIPDPLNPRLIWNGINAYNNFFYMPGAIPTELTLFRKGIPHGILSRHLVQTNDLVMGKQRVVHLYHPPVETRVPILFILDGLDYLHRAKLNIIVDNMIAQDRIRPIALAFIQNGGRARTVEYSCSEATIGFLMDSILPLAGKNLDLEAVEEGNYGILGASLGGLMAIFTGLRLPNIFRKVLCQSGAFITPEYQSVVMDLIRFRSATNIDIWMDCGKFEWLLEGNKEMADLLMKMKYKVEYHEFSGGHNYTSWRNEISSGLGSLYGKK